MIETRCNRTASLQLSDSDDAQNLDGGQEVKSGYGRVTWAITRSPVYQPKVLLKHGGSLKEHQEISDNV